METFYNPFTKKYEPLNSSGSGTSPTSGGTNTFYNPISKTYEAMGQVQAGAGNTYDEDIQKLMQESARRGINVPETVTKKDPSILNRLFGLLNVGETAPMAMAAITGEDNPLAAYGKSVAKRGTLQGLEGPSYADVLEKMGVPQGKLPIGSLRGLAGLGMDIALDPMTYLGVGLLSRAGRALKSIGGKGAKVASKIPVVGEKVVKPITKAVGETGEALGRAFIGRRFNLRNVAGGKELSDILDALSQVSRGKANLQTQEMIDKLVKFKPADMSADKYLASLREGLERISKVGGKTAEPTKYLHDLSVRLGKEEQKSGVLGQMIGEGQMGLFSKNDKGYFHRELTDIGKEFFKKGTDPEIMRIRELGIEHGPEIARRFFPDKTVSEINEMLGKKIFEEDPIKAMASRIYSSAQRTETANFFRNITKQANKVEWASTTAKPGWLKMPENISGFKIPGLSNVYVPKEVYEELNKVGATLTSDKSVKGVLGIYDKLLGLWKGSVTTRFPGFHVRNWYGAAFNNYIMGVNNPLRYEQAYKLAKGLNETIELGGKKYTYKGLRDMLTRSGAIGGQGYFDIMQKAGGASEAMVKKPNALSNLIPGPKWMEGIETNVRGALFIDQLAKGKNADEAVKAIFKAHFDYAPEALTAFEKEYMRRIIPFYRWMRGNIPFQLEQIAKQPSKYANIGKALRSLSGKQEDAQYLPEYMQRGFPTKLDSEKGKTSFLYGMGLPIEDVNKMDPREIIQQLSPAITTPIEIATGQNLYFGKPLAESNYAPVVKHAPKILQDALGYNEYVTSKGKTVSRVDPVKWKLLTSILGRYVYTLDTITDEQAEPLVKALEVGTGFKTRTVDIGEEKTRRTRELMEKIGNYLYGKGAVNRFQRYYIPKPKENL